MVYLPLFTVHHSPSTVAANQRRGIPRTLQLSENKSPLMSTSVFFLGLD
jgi:hypothetical protein